MKQRLSFTLVFVAFALFLLLGPLKPYLVETAALTPFYADEFTFRKLFGTHCGVLFQVAAGLQSCFAYPWLGACLFISVLVAMAYVQRWAFRVGDNWFGICWVTSFALLTNYTQLGYLIYTIKHPAVAFAPALGFLAAFALIGLWFHLKHWWWKLAFLLLTPILGFWLLGFFGALVAPFVGFCEMGIARFKKFDEPSPTKRRTSRRQVLGSGTSHMLWGLALFFLGLLLPSLLRLILHRDLDFDAGHIPFSNLIREMRRPWVLALTFPLFYAIFTLDGKRRWTIAVSSIVFCLAGVAAYHYSFLDSNFLDTLRMKHAAEAGEWNRVMVLARENKQEPTRAQVCLTRLALFKTGRMGDELFTYPEGSAAYNAPQQNQWLRLMIGPLLYYHYGKTGFAYRWAMEDLVEYGERPAYLRYLHSVALLNGEYALARRYERTLARTLFYKPSTSSSPSSSSSAPSAPSSSSSASPAHSVSFPSSSPSSSSPASPAHSVSSPVPSASSPSSSRLGAAHICADNSEAESIRPLLNYTDQLDGDNGLVEFYLLHSFALSEGGSREMVELSLMNSLIIKDLTGFWPRFLALLPTWQGHIPTHYQEAALMVAQLQGGAPVNDLPIDPAIGQRFQRLVQASAQNGDNAANAIALRPEFGNTYWYYYFFVEGLKTN